MNIPQDKKKHFAAGFAIAAAASLFAGYIVGLLIAILAAAGKEIYDKVTGKGTAELLDFAATAAGATAAVVVSAAVSSLFCVMIT